MVDIFRGPLITYWLPQDSFANWRTWTWSYNINLIGKDKLPPGVMPGDALYDLPQKSVNWQIDLRSTDLRTWTWQYNPNLIGKDRFPPGEAIYDLPPRAYPDPATRTWTWSFNFNLIVVAAPFSQDDWPTPRAYPEPATRTWTWSYNLNLIGQDRLPAGEQITDLPPRDYQRPQDLRTWTWSYNRNLVGKDAMVAGEQLTDLPPRAYPEPATRTWTWQYNVNLIGQDVLPAGDRIYDRLPDQPYPGQTWIGARPPVVTVMPFSQNDWPTPRLALPLRAITWTWSYNLNLIGQDRLPAGEQLTDLPPRDYQRPQDLRTWTWSYNRNLVGKDAMTVGEQVTDLPPRPYPEPATRTWTWQYNLNLVGQDALPVGDRIYDRLPDQPYLGQTWFGRQPPAVTVMPFSQNDWPTPRLALPLRAITWTWQYNPNLVGQDRLPTGKQLTDLPPRAFPEPATRTWIFSYNLDLFVPAGEQLTDLPPRDYLQPAKTWTWQYNPNLIGQDKLPVGVRSTDLPPADYSRILQTWIAPLNLALVTVVPPSPHNQYDWPLPRPLTEPDRAFTATFSRTLIGQDVMPPGKPFTDLPPRAYPEPATRTWTFTYSLDLIGQDRFPPGARVFELAPIGPPYPTQNRTWTWQYNPNLIAQDAFPPGQRITDLPPRDFDRILQTWNSPLNLPLGVAPQTPFAQYDWPLPRPGGQPDRSFIAVFPLPLVGQDRLPAGYRAYDLPPRAFEHPNQNRTFTATFPPELVGQDRLPNRQMDWPLPTIAKQPENRTFMASYNPNLVGQDAFPPGRIVTDLPPIGPEYPMNLRFFSQSPAVPVPAPPPVTGGLHEPQFFTTMGMSIGSPLNPTSDS